MPSQATPSGQGTSASVEWRHHWPLVFAGAVGYSATGLHTYTIGAMIVPLQREFDWSRAQITLGMTIAGVLGATLSVPVGMLVDRVGPRPVGLAGVALTTGAFALIGTASGGTANWVLLWTVFAVASLGVQASIWTSAIASSFERSRGLALALTLSGGSLAAIVIPILAMWLIGAFGWRSAFVGLGALWAAVCLPIMALGFRSVADRQPKRCREDPADETQSVSLSGSTVADALRSAAFYKLLLATGLFTFTVLGTAVNFVPILGSRGASALAAASMASLIGVFSIVGRLGTGLLLDRFAGHRVGAATFVLPAVGLVLLMIDGGNSAFQACAAAAVGLTLGAETDVIAFLASWHFGLRNLGVLFGALTGALALGAALGPLSAAALFDHFGSYTSFLKLAICLLLVGAAALASMPGAPVHQRNLPNT